MEARAAGTRPSELWAWHQSGESRVPAVTPRSVLGQVDSYGKSNLGHCEAVQLPPTPTPGLFWSCVSLGSELGCSPQVLSNGSPAGAQGGGQGNGGNTEDAPWLLRVLPGQGAEWRAWCAVSGSWSWCPLFWLWKVRGDGHQRSPTCLQRPWAGGK